jgi:hypothetical protein
MVIAGLRAVAGHPSDTAPGCQASIRAVALDYRARFSVSSC